MATVVNNPSGTVERSIDRGEDTSAGWAVAVIVLLVVLAVGGFLFARYFNAAPAATPNGGTNIDVTVPGTGGTNPGGTNPTPGTGGTQPAPTTP
ncbi:MAG TPA: hypothetical protein VD928_00425 [Candidatus Paceibacterota bacterium]|nr:hypothetical protein [Candidatus Paceibacterota bacterium]